MRQLFDLAQCRTPVCKWNEGGGGGRTIIINSRVVPLSVFTYCRFYCRAVSSSDDSSSDENLSDSDTDSICFNQLKKPSTPIK